MRPALPALTSLRFFAATEVVLYHEVYAKGLLDRAPAPLRNLTSAGPEAVIFFFILSGFILAYVYRDDETGRLNTSAREFWRARFARIFPAYLAGLVLAFPHFFYLTFLSGVQSLHDFAVGAVLVPLLLQAWWPPAVAAWNTPAWSLSVEFFFYALFPVLLAPSARIKPWRLVLGAYLAIAAVVALKVLLKLPGDHIANSPAANFKDFFPLLHLPEFLFGIGLGLFFLARRQPARLHHFLFLLGSLAAVLVIAFHTDLPGWANSNVVLAPLFGLIILSGAHVSASCRLLKYPPLLLLGEASYATYIIHLPLGWLWNFSVPRLIGASLPPALNFTLYFIVLIAASLAIFAYVEKPLRRTILGHREHRPA